MMKFEDAIKSPITVLTGSKDDKTKVPTDEARVGAAIWSLVSFAAGSVVARSRAAEGKMPILKVFG